MSHSIACRDYTYLANEPLKFCISAFSSGFINSLKSGACMFYQKVTVVMKCKVIKTSATTGTELSVNIVLNSS